LRLSSLKKAHALLLSGNVFATEIQPDRQGTHYFTVRDLEGHEIEICEKT